MAGEQQTEPHQAGVGPSPREALEALERADLRDRAEAAEDELARVRDERDEAREEIKRQNGWAHDMIRERDVAEARIENQTAEIVALIRSYANVHMTKALADLIEHKYAGPADQEHKT